MNDHIIIVGAGLAGSEAAWQAAQAGIKVTLYEMRPNRNTPAHHSDNFAELVCSNSLRSNSLENAVGLIKEEMRHFNSLIMDWAHKTQVPAGGALAVDRLQFAKGITETLEQHPNINVIREEIEQIPPQGPVIIATGPLTSGAMAKAVQDLAGQEYLYFYDAAAPIVTYDSIDHDKVFRASRYGKGEADYLNCPFTKEEYEIFWHELVNAEGHAVKEFEKPIFFEGCMPVEIMASRGIQTLLFGPLKPVGLDDPRTDRQPYAVVQLRQDNAEGTLYNLVGFQTHLKWPEQKRVFGLIPGLEKAEFVRYGVMHRNTFLNSPYLLEPTMQFKTRKDLFFAGQMTGVEGYIESAASGLVAGLNAARVVKGQEPLVFPIETALGALCHYITSTEVKNFQPMNINFGLLPPLEGKKIRDKKLKYRTISERALNSLARFSQEWGL